jgi:hypothetical protein
MCERLSGLKRLNATHATSGILDLGAGAQSNA